jgi:hypothetical protein
MHIHIHIINAFALAFINGHLTAFLYRSFFYIYYYTQNHEIQGNTVTHELLYFLVFRDFECNNRHKKIIDMERR